MRFEDLRRWHWIVIGLMVGLAMGYLHADVEPPANHRSMKQSKFEQEIARRPVSGYPMIRNVIIYPAVPTGVESANRLVPSWIAWMRFQYREPTPSKENPNAWTYQTWWCESDASATKEARPAVLARLDELAKDRPHMQYRYCWWSRPAASYAVWAVGSVGMIGGIWPSLVNMLVGAGMGMKSERKPKNRWWKRDKKTAQVRSESIEIAADGTSVPASPVKAAEPEMDLEQEVARLLSGKKSALPLPAEKLTPVSEKPKEKKEYGGQYWPSVAHAGKKKNPDEDK